MSARLWIVPRVDYETDVRHVGREFQQEVFYAGASRREHAIFLPVQLSPDYLIKRSPGEQEKNINYSSLSVGRRKLVYTLREV